MHAPYLVPKSLCSVETIIHKSRFVTVIDRASDVDVARSFISSVRARHQQANHHVYAFKIGYGASTTEGMSDDGEPSGTAGSPTLTVLRGSDIGDIVLVTARYFGGIKLGTGGLVKAYTEAAQNALGALQTELKVEYMYGRTECSYSDFAWVKKLVQEQEGELLEDFGETVLLTIKIEANRYATLQADLIDRSGGRIVLARVD